MEEEKGSKKGGGWFWLLPVAGFLLVGGFIALVTMRDAAEKLSGRPQAGGNPAGGGPALAGGGSALESRDFFSSDETVSPEALASYEKHRLEVEDRLYEKGPSAGKVAAFSAGAAQAGSGDGADAAGGAAAARPGGGPGPAPRMSASLSSAGGAGGGGSRSSLGAAGASSFGGPGARPAVVASASGETGVRGGASRSGGGGVIESLRSAWRGSVMGAREASNDAARTLLARSFDGSPASERLSLQYDEKMKKELDVVNPDSIPKFLRDQDISADRASAFEVPDIKGVKVNREGTEASLKEDKNYQEALSKMAGGMLNPMFGGLTDKNEAAGADGGPETAGGLSIPDTPQDDQWFNDLGNEQLMNAAGFEDCGESCGCSCAAPCCCLPQAPAGCPLYGPFLPDDPCGSDFGAPPPGGELVWV